MEFDRDDMNQLEISETICKILILIFSKLSLLIFLVTLAVISALTSDMGTILWSVF